MPSLVDNHLADRFRTTPDPDQASDWPSDRLGHLRDAGVFRWGLPVEFGGLPLAGPQMLEGYIELARLCLTTAFILTQRDAACHRIANSENLALRQKLLPDHCAGRALATVGISHLSTSRQHWSRPSVIARRTGSGFELTGEAPWVTGARHADLLVTGATIEDDQQILVAIPTNRTGVNIGEPLKLLALNASCTGSVNLERVAVSTDEIIVGPAPQVLKLDSKGGTGSFTTTAVAIGAAQRTLDGLRGESESRPELIEIVSAFTTEHAKLRDDLLAGATRLSEGSTVPGAAEDLRQRANSIASRAALAYVCSAKGAGFVSGHPAERLLREAMFFQVWSCPPAVTKVTLTELSHR
jgi:alkylation response protein AidB-like acyl-CoA dehydrogenase